MAPVRFLDADRRPVAKVLQLAAGQGRTLRLTQFSTVAWTEFVFQCEAGLRPEWASDMLGSGHASAGRPCETPERPGKLNNRFLAIHVAM